MPNRRMIVLLAALAAAAACSGGPSPKAPAAARPGVPEGKTAVLYSPAEATVTTKVLLRVLPGGAEVTTPFAYSESHVASRDGKWLARFRGNELRVAPSYDLTREVIAARTSLEAGSITGAAFSADGSSLAYMTEIIGDGEEDPTELRLFVVNRNGTGRREAGMFKSKREVFLVAYDAAGGRIYWAEGDLADEEDLQAAGDLVVVDVAARRIARKLPGMATDLFTRTFSKMYWADNAGRVFESNTDGGSRRLLYQVPTSDKLPDPSGSRVEGMLLTPAEDALVIAAHEAHALYASLVYLPLGGANRRVLMENLTCDSYPDSISPDGTTLWIGSPVCPPKMLDLATVRTRETGITQAVDLWAWLVGTKEPGPSA